MLYGRRLNNSICYVHKRAPILTCKGNQFSYKKLLEEDGLLCQLIKKLKILATVIFEIKLVSEIMRGAWLDGPNVKSTCYGILLIKDLVSQIWELGLQTKEKSDTLNEFETKVKPWYPDQFTSKLPKFYIGQLGFIGSIHASFNGRISLYVLNTEVYLQYLTIIPVKSSLFKVSNIKALTTPRQIFPRMLPLTFSYIS